MNETGKISNVTTILIVEDGEGEAKLIAKFLRIKFRETLDILEVVTANDLLNFIKTFPNNEMRFDVTLADNTNDEGEEKIFFHQEISKMAEETRRKLGYIVNISGGEDDFEMIKKIVGEEYTGSALKGMNFTDRIKLEVAKGIEVMNEYRSTPEQYKTSQFFLDELDKYKDVLKDNTTEDAKLLKKEIAVIYSELLRGIDHKDYLETVELAKRLKIVRTHDLLKDKVSNDDLVQTDKFIEAIQKHCQDVIKIANEAIEDRDLDKIYNAYIGLAEIRGLIYLFGEGRIDNPFLYNRLSGEYISLVIDSGCIISSCTHDLGLPINSEKRKNSDEENWKALIERNKTFEKRLTKETSNGTKEMLKVENMTFNKLQKILKGIEDIKIQEPEDVGLSRKKFVFSMQMFYFIRDMMILSSGDHRISFESQEDGLVMWLHQSLIELNDENDNINAIREKNDLRNKADIDFVVTNYLNGIHENDLEQTIQFENKFINLPDGDIVAENTIEQTFKSFSIKFPYIK